LKVLDLQGGAHNYSGILLLRLVEKWPTLIPNRKKYRSILLSKSKIVKAAQALEHTAKYVLDIVKFSTKSKERVKFKN
jgi:hypothetical protein